MIVNKYYKTIRVIVDSDGGGTPFYIENIDGSTQNFYIYKTDTTTPTNLYYRIDNGEWLEYDTTTLPKIPVPSHSRIYLRGDNPENMNCSLCFGNTNNPCECKIGGYLTSLIRINDFISVDTIPKSFFSNMFRHSTSDFSYRKIKVVSAGDVITSNIKYIKTRGFYYTFYGAPITDAPMFENVIEVEGDYTFYFCFGHCKSLVTAPTFEKLTRITEYIGSGSNTDTFGNCFVGCTSLINPPSFSNLEYIDTNKNEKAFEYCFHGCTSLVTTPNFRKLTTLGEQFTFGGCFIGCTSLQTIIAPRPSSWSTSIFNNWVNGVLTGGTFYKKKELSIPTSTSGIPVDWTVVEEA